ncbi:MAG: glycosyltransferase [Candidatus Altiarchaeota archaeon]
MKASILLAVKNEENTIGECIQSLVSQDYPHKDYEVVVVDDCSSDRTGEILEGFKPQIKVFRNHEGMGRAYSRNLAVENAIGKIVCFIDGDAYAEEGWLTYLMEAYSGEKVDGRTYPTDILGGVGGFIGAWNRENIYARYTEEGEFRLFRVQQGPKTMLSPVGFATCNCSYPRKLVLDAGGFDEGMRGGEDLDLNLRIKEKEHVFLYVPEARVYHMHPGSLRSLSRKWFEKGRYHAGITRRRPGWDCGFIRRILNPAGFTASTIKTPHYAPIDLVVRASFIAGLLFNKFESYLKR